MTPSSRPSHTAANEKAPPRLSTSSVAKDLDRRGGARPLPPRHNHLPRVGCGLIRRQSLSERGTRAVEPRLLRSSLRVILSVAWYTRSRTRSARRSLGILDLVRVPTLAIVHNTPFRVYARKKHRYQHHSLAYTREEAVLLEAKFVTHIRPRIPPRLRRAAPAGFDCGAYAPPLRMTRVLTDTCIERTARVVMTWRMHPVGEGLAPSRFFMLARGRG